MAPVEDAVGGVALGADAFGCGMTVAWIVAWPAGTFAIAMSPPRAAWPALAIQELPVPSPLTSLLTCSLSIFLMLELVLAVKQSHGMRQKAIPEKALAALLEQAFRLTHSSEHAEGLYPAQWAALRFVTNSRGAPPTASRLARFQGMSLGPVSRTVRTLIDKGLLKRVDAAGRTEALALTHKGRVLMERDPAQRISRAMSGLAPRQREALAEALEAVIRNLLVPAFDDSLANTEDRASSTARL